MYAYECTERRTISPSQEVRSVKGSTPLNLAS